MDAAELAGLKVLSLMNENTAVAMKYAIDRKFENTKEHNVIFYDMGSSSVKSSFVTFSAYDVLDGKKNKTVESFEVKAVAWDEFLGGHDFDARIAKLMAEDFDEKHSKQNDGNSVFDSPRAMARLLKEAERYKVVLSSNKETPISVEALTNDIDLKTHITREQFEELCADLLERSVKPVEALLEETGKEPGEVHAVVIIGGGSRIPKIQDLLLKVMDREQLNRNLNGDEAAALGAGFYAAGLSPSFRVRKVSVEDIFPYGVTATVSRGASSTSEKPPPTAEVFGKNSKMPLKKVLTFNRKEDFYMDIKVSNPERLPECDSPMIGAYNITGVEKAVEYNETEKPKISITFELDRSGLLVVTKAEGKAESWTEETVTKKKDTNTTEDENATATEDGEEGEEKSEEESEEKSEESTEEATADETDESSEDSAEGEGEEKAEEADASEEAADDAEAEEETETKMVKKVHRVTLGWNYTAVDMTPLTEEHSKASKKMMKAIRKRMDDIAEMNKIKNDVEAHVFQTRDKFEYNEELKKVMSEEEMDTIRASLSEVEEWLWDDHELQEYKDKLKELRKDMAPANTRAQEMEDRPKAFAQAKEQIESIKAYMANETAMENVNVNDTAVIQAATEKFEAWVTEKEAAQEAVALTDTPAVLASEIAAEANEHRDAVSEALRPKVKPKEKKKREGPVETKKEKAARIKFEKADKAAKKATKKLDDLMGKLAEECGLPATCEPVPVEPKEPEEVAEGEEAKEEEGEDAEAKEEEEPEAEPVDCSFTEGEPDTCGEGCTYTEAIPATNPKPVEEEAEEEAAEEPASDEADEEKATEESGDDETAAAEEGEEAAKEEEEEEKKPKKEEKNTCEALPKSVKKAKKSLKTAAKALTKAEEEYTKEKEFVEANRAARLAKEAKKAEEAEAKKKAREEKKKKKKAEEAEAEDEEGDDVDEEDAEEKSEEETEGEEAEGGAEGEEEEKKDEL
jgi:hypoxia up-regulated 1